MFENTAGKGLSPDWVWYFCGILCSTCVLVARDGSGERDTLVILEYQMATTFVQYISVSEIGVHFKSKNVFSYKINPFSRPF